MALPPKVTKNLMSNEWIGERLRALKKTKGSLAHVLGIDPARISEIIGGRRNVQMAEIPLMAEMLEMSTSQLVALLAPKRSNAAVSLKIADLPASTETDGAFARIAEPSPMIELLRNLPILGTSVFGENGAFSLKDDIVDYGERIPSLIHAKNAYGLYMQGDSMSPRFEEGWLLQVNPNRPTRPGDSVVLRVKDQHSSVVAYVKTLVSRDASALKARQFYPERILEWPQDRILSIHRIIGVTEM